MTRKTRKALRKCLSILIAARNYKYYSQDVDEISAVMGVSPEKIQEWMEIPEWLLCRALRVFAVCFIALYLN